MDTQTWTAMPAQAALHRPADALVAEWMAVPGPRARDLFVAATPKERRSLGLFTADDFARVITRPLSSSVAQIDEGVFWTGGSSVRDSEGRMQATTGMYFIPNPFHRAGHDAAVGKNAKWEATGARWTGVRDLSRLSVVYATMDHGSVAKGLERLADAIVSRRLPLPSAIVLEADPRDPDLRGYRGNVEERSAVQVFWRLQEPLGLGDRDLARWFRAQAIACSMLLGDATVVSDPCRRMRLGGVCSSRRGPFRAKSGAPPCSQTIVQLGQPVSIAALLADHDGGSLVGATALTEAQLAIYGELHRTPAAVYARALASLELAPKKRGSGFRKIKQAEREALEVEFDPAGTRGLLDQGSEVEIQVQGEWRTITVSEIATVLTDLGVRTLRCRCVRPELHDQHDPKWTARVGVGARAGTYVACDTCRMTWRECPRQAPPPATPGVSEKPLTTHRVKNKTRRQSLSETPEEADARDASFRGRIEARASRHAEIQDLVTKHLALRSQGLEDEAALHWAQAKALMGEAPHLGVNNVREVWGRYLEPEHVHVDGVASGPRCVLLKSWLGTGKTNVMEQLTKHEPRVVVLTHRRELARQLAQRLNVACYLDLPKGPISEPRVAICLDSLGRLSLAELAGAVVVIDELESVLLHLLGETIAVRGTVGPIHRRLETLLRFASRVITADAFLTEKSVRAIRRLRGRAPGEPQADEMLLLNRWYDPSRAFLFFSSKADLVGALFDAIESDERVAVFCTSKRATKVVHRLKGLNRHVVVINSETTRQPRSAGDLLREISECDVLVASPSLSTGVTIDVEGHFNRIFVIGDAGEVPASDIMQMTGRVRHPRCSIIHAWITPLQRDRIEDPAELRAAYLEREQWTHRELRFVENLGWRWEARADGTPSRTPDQPDLLDLACEVLAPRNADTNALERRVVALLEADGVPYEMADSLDWEIAAELASTWSEASDDVADDEALEVALAPYLRSEEECEQVERSPYATRERLASARRTRLLLAYGRDANASVVRDDADGRRQRELALLSEVQAVAAGEKRTLLVRDAWDRRSQPIVGRTARANRGAAGVDTLRIYGVPDGDPARLAAVRWAMIDAETGPTVQTAGEAQVQELWVEVEMEAPADVTITPERLSREQARRLAWRVGDLDPTPRTLPFLASYLEALGVHASEVERAAARSAKRKGKKDAKPPATMEPDGQMEIGHGRKGTAYRVNRALLSRAIDEAAAWLTRLIPPKVEALDPAS